MSTTQQTQQRMQDSRQDLQAADGLKRIRETVKKTPTCFFTTALEFGDSGGARPMSVLQVDDQGRLWFLSASDSHHNAEITANPLVTLYFQGSEHADFLQLKGRARILVDRAKINELWSPLFKPWFNDGVDDPRITLIEVTPTDGYYWDNKHGNLVAGIKMLLGAALGKPIDDAVHGRVRI